MKGNTIMKKTLRYLLIAIAILGVLSVNAQTRQYATTHSHEQATYMVQVNPQMPTTTMGYSHTDYMTSGSSLPQSAVTGTSTTYGEGGGPRKVGPRKVGEDEGFEPEEPEPNVPGNPFPIGDAAIPLALLACAYLIIRVVRKRSGMSRFAE